MKCIDTQAIIFDLDGALIDSSIGVWEATNYALAKFGLPPRSLVEIYRYLGSPLEEMFSSFCDVSFQELRVHFQTRGREVIADQTILLPGASAALEACFGRGYALAIGTTKTSFHVERIVRRFSWEGIISATACGDETPAVKPAPDIFLLAASKLGVSTERSVVVGDTVNDFLAARRAGMRVAMVESPFGDRDAAGRCEPDWRFGSIADFAEFISQTSNEKAP